MKFDCDKRADRIALRYLRRSEWHRWFAWYPVRLGPHDCRWLEWVECKGTYWHAYDSDGWDWKYRPIGAA